MKRKDKKIMLKAEQIITKYREDDSIYYHELVKSYKEYKELENIDKTTNDLYVGHINKLCEFIVERKHSNAIVVVMVLLFISMLGLTTYSTIRYYDISTNLKKNIIKANSSTSLVVAYKDLENFNAFELSDEQNYVDLKPLLVKLGANNTSEEDYQIKYNIYIIEQNEEVAKDDLLEKDVFLYNVSTNHLNTGIKTLKNAKIKNDKILIFTGVLNSKGKENVEIRMWIDKNTKIKYKNKVYKFKLYVDGYVV